MDYTPHLPAMRARSQRTAALLQTRRLVLCFGDRVGLSVFAGGSRAAGSVVGAATTAAEGAALVQRCQPDLLVVSDRLEQGDGLSLAATIKRQRPSLQVLLLVGEQQRWCRLQEVLRAGCDGMVRESRFGMGAALAALQALARGGVYVDRGLAAAIQGLPAGWRPLEPISPRERQVLGLVASGCGNAEIGRRLFLSVDTVKTHLRSVLRKLPARDRAHAAVLGVCWGLIDWPEPTDGR